MMIKYKMGRAILLALSMAQALCGCADKAPKGQVVAVVNGEEVTRRDLAAEPAAGGSEQPQPALAAMLSGVIDRKLAVAEAERLALDKTPQYVAQSKRLEEVLLSRTLFDRWAGEMPAPGAKAIADYIAHNPQRFDGRKLFLVDRIEAADVGTSKNDLEPLQTNDAVAAYLDAHGQPYRRQRTVLDSANLPLPLYRQLLSLAPRYPLAFVQDGRLNVLAILQARDEPLAPADKNAAAVAALKQAGIEQRLATLRKTAKIAYQPGYRPAGPPSSATH